MTLYLFKASLSLLVLAGFYALVLAPERLPRFKRFYLLGSLLFSALIPLIELPAEVVSGVPVPALPFASGPAAPLQAGTPPVPDSTDAGAYLIGGYFAVMAVLLLRLVRNLGTLAQRIRRAPKRAFRSATLVLTDAPGTPYAFLGYLFVARPTFERGALADELLTHELTHIRQYHSLDILLIEVLRCVGWFNPVLHWMKGAMQLNHEFLADEAVNAHHRDIPRYQRLLLTHLTTATPLHLTSSLSFHSTKQRFLMMTRHTSAARAGWAYGSTALLLSLVTALLISPGTPTTAQVVPAARPATRPQPPAPASETEVERMERLYGDKWVDTWPDGRTLVRKKYASLTPEDKKWVRVLPVLPRKTPTEAEFESWKNPKKFGIWVDDKRVRNFAGTPLKASDIVAYTGSYVHKNARQPEGYLYHMSLMTEANYQAYLKRRTENPVIVLRKDLPPPEARPKK
jgi:bla regulator protein BlaR1